MKSVVIFLSLLIIFLISTLIIEKRKKDDMLKKCAFIIRWVLAITIGIVLIIVKKGLPVIIGCMLILLTLLDVLLWIKSSPRKNNPRDKTKKPGKLINRIIELLSFW